MRTTWLRTLGLAAVTTISPLVLAADHADGPAASMDKTADIADLFTWASTDGKTTYFVMDIGKDMKAGDKFSNAVKYVFHTTSMPAYGALAGVKSVDIICTFDSGTPQKTTCWVGNQDTVSGDASVAATPVVSTSGKVKLFAGLRDDPFFFNLDGFNSVATIVHGAAAAVAPTFDKDGCPRGLGATAQALASTLKSGPDGGTPVDAFATFNVLSIVLGVDTSLVTTGGPIVGVWASTNK